MKNVIIVGGGGISKVAAAIVDEMSDLNLLGFLDDYKEKGSVEGKFKKDEILGSIADIPHFLMEDDIYFFIAFAGFTNPESSYYSIQRLAIPQNRLINIIHEKTYCPKNYCALGKGILLAPFSQVGPEAEIGNYTTLLGNSFIGHNTILEEFVHVASNAVVGANNYIGRGTHIGTNSVTRENVKIGKNVIVGSGAVVLQDVPDNAIMVGNPARILKYRSQ